MYSSSHPVSNSMNGLAGDLVDGSGTINPAALNTSVSVLPPATSISAPAPTSRGVKRSRSPESFGERRLSGEAEDDDQKRRKRGRPPKVKTTLGGVSESQTTGTPQININPQDLRTPQYQTQGPSQRADSTSSRTSPPKTTPTKPVVKALPTVRDHTTDQLSPEGDEYVPRETDEQGERKVSQTGHPQDGREYKCRTFLVPNRGDKLFMLATECARVLGYRDSYLLFNKNRSLFKIIASQPEKDDLIHQEILPYSYRSRQIAIVTAKSMFRQFGSRVIQNGRRVRDDYWEAKARKQGFTEEDMAGEKRPGAAKARDAAAAEAAAAALPLGHHTDIIYSNNGVGPMGQNMNSNIAPLPMINLAPGNIMRPRQEITGTPYQDRPQPSPVADTMNQASHTAEYNKVLNQQRLQRSKFLKDTWEQPREPFSAPQRQPTETSPGASQSMQSPQLLTGGLMSAGQGMLPHQPSQMMSPPGYSQQPQQQGSIAQSPVRGGHPSIRPDQMHQRPSGLTYPSGGQPSQYGYPMSSQMWGQPPPQPQQSPLSAQHGMPQYNPAASQQPLHPSQSPHQSSPLHQQQTGSMHSGMTYQSMGNMTPGYPGMGNRGLYQQQGHSPQQYIQQTTAAQQAGMQGWAPPTQQPHLGQNWPY